MNLSPPQTAKKKKTRSLSLSRKCLIFFPKKRGEGGENNPLCCSPLHRGRAGDLFFRLFLADCLLEGATKSFQPRRFLFFTLSIPKCSPSTTLASE